jgi:N-acetylmuramoyl-L-alanine amidase
VIVELQNTKLTKTVQEKVSEKGLPGEVQITQPRPQSVTVSINLEKIGDYKLLPLKEPDRLVLEIYYPTDNRPIEAVQAPPPIAQPVSPEPTPPSPSTPPAESAPAPPHGTGPTGPSPGQPPQAASPAPHVPPPPQIRSARRPARDDIKTIVIDPGHGGKDPGAIGRGKVQEKRITLKVGLKLRDLITQRLGRRVLMTRDHDVFVELEDRTKFANSQGRTSSSRSTSIRIPSVPREGWKCTTSGKPAIVVRSRWRRVKTERPSSPPGSGGSTSSPIS